MVHVIAVVISACLLGHLEAYDVEECTETEHTSALQTRRAHAGAHHDEAPSPSTCALPSNAAWAKVLTAGQQPFYMAVYRTKDIVSNSLLTQHNWEHLNTNVYGVPGHAYDIGGNVGFYTFTLAKAGWNVSTFEPMPSNLALFKATLCANPDVADRIDLHPIGLGDSNQHCRLISDEGNLGDGNMMCSTDDKNQLVPAGYVVRATFDVNRLDDVMAGTKFSNQHVDFVKIDVEGYECHVFRGAQKLLAQKPRMIQSEVWQHMQGCTPKQYLKRFHDAQYQIKADVHCQKNGNPDGPPQAIADYWMCDESQAPWTNPAPISADEASKALTKAFVSYLQLGSFRSIGEHDNGNQSRRTLLMISSEPHPL